MVLRDHTLHELFSFCFSLYLDHEIIEIWTASARSRSLYCWTASARLQTKPVFLDCVCQIESRKDYWVTRDPTNIDYLVPRDPTNRLAAVVATSHRRRRQRVSDGNLWSDIRIEFSRHRHAKLRQKEPPLKMQKPDEKPDVME